MIFTFFVGVGLAFLLGLLGISPVFTVAFLVIFFLIAIVSNQ